MLWTLLTQSWKFKSSCSSESNVRPKMVPIWSKHGSYMAPKSTHFEDTFLGPYWLSLKNSIAPDGLEVRQGQKLSCFQMWTHHTHMPYTILTKFWKFKSSCWSGSKARPNMILAWAKHNVTWYKNVVNSQTFFLDHDDSIFKILGFLLVWIWS